ncbi:MAG: hypothetical protein LBF84_00670 [Holosporales bacterium]|jgi:hypothetical protein|nr:hypothetical protein [Holosporales bacterium]
MNTEAEGLFAVMKNLKCKVYDDKLVKDTPKKMTAAASKLAVKSPETIDRCKSRFCTAESKGWK